MARAKSSPLPAFVISFPGTQPRLFLCILFVAAFLLQQSRTVVTEVMGPTKPELSTL